MSFNELGSLGSVWNNFYMFGKDLDLFVGVLERLELDNFVLNFGLVFLDSN